MKTRKRYSLKTEILFVAMTAMLIVDISISIIVSNVYRNVFVDTYGASQKQVFGRIENELNNRHENVAVMFDQVTGSWHIPYYFHTSQQGHRASTLCSHVLHNVRNVVRS